MARPIFHLAFPVSSLDRAERFYTEVLGARIGRRQETWMDVLLWGHQLTLHEAPQDLRDDESAGHRHFGVVLGPEEFEEFQARLRELDDFPFTRPATAHEGTPLEQAKLYIEDPDGYRIEIKSYRDPRRALHLEPPGTPA